MQPVPRIQSGTPITQELLDSIVRAIHELQGHAITGVNYPLMRAGGMLSAMDNVNQALVTVQNDTGGDLDIGAVVGLDGPLEDDPTGDLAAFQNSEMTFSGIAPSETAGHTGKFAVLADPIPAGSIGRACVQGVVRVQMTFVDGDEEWADIKDTDAGSLLAGSTGSARILWRDGTGAGTVWAICLIGCGGGSGGSTDDSGGSFTAHYSMSRYFTEWPEETPAFWSLGGSLNSFIQIALDVRKCQYDLPTGSHPGCTLAKANQGFAGNCLASWAGDDDAWFDLGYTARDADGDLIGQGVEAIPCFHIQARVTTAGSLELRTVNDGDSMLSCVIAGAVWRKSHPEAPGTIEFGPGGCHDDTDWGDGVWEPET